MNDYTVDFNEAGDGVRILDQTLLPGREVQLELCSREALCEAVVRLRIRGAPALGVFAAFSLCALAAGRREGPFDGEAELSALRADAEALRVTRPTAVNLGWALDRMLNAAEVFVRRGRVEGGKGSAGGDGEKKAAFVAALRAEALAVRGEDEAMCRAIGEHGLTLFGEGDGVLTHCNAGRLAASRWGTALAPFYLAKERGRKFTVYADETRPLLQGARLTAWELSRAGVEVCLLCDNMAGELMKRGKIAAVFVAGRALSFRIPRRAAQGVGPFGCRAGKRRSKRRLRGKRWRSLHFPKNLLHLCRSLLLAALGLALFAPFFPFPFLGQFFRLFFGEFLFGCLARAAQVLFGALPFQALRVGHGPLGRRRAGRFL